MLCSAFAKEAYTVRAYMLVHDNSSIPRLTKEEEAQCRKICEEVWELTYRIRPWED